MPGTWLPSTHALDREQAAVQVKQRLSARQRQRRRGRDTESGQRAGSGVLSHRLLPADVQHLLDEHPLATRRRDRPVPVHQPLSHHTSRSNLPEPEPVQHRAKPRTVIRLDITGHLPHPGPSLPVGHPWKHQTVAATPPAHPEFTLTAAPGTAPPVILAVEGLCFAGKTTLARALGRRLGVPVAAEYADLTSLPPFPPPDRAAARAALSALLAAEAHRTRQARASGSHLVIYDRSPLTVIGHEHAMRARGIPADPETAAAWFTAAACTGAILTPTAYIYLTVPDDTCRQRQEARGHLPEHLVAPDVRTALTRFYDTCFAAASQARVLRADGTAPLALLTSQSAAFAARPAGTAEGTPLPLPDAKFPPSRPCTPREATDRRSG